MFGWIISVVFVESIHHSWAVFNKIATDKKHHIVQNQPGTDCFW